MRILLVVYDNESFIHFFPLGIAYIAAVLRREGYDVTIYNQDVHHFEESHLTSYLNENRFDVIGLGVIGGYFQYKKLLLLSEAINRSINRPPYYILGGHGPAPEPEYFLKKTKADVAIIGEGEETIVELIRAIAEKKAFNDIKGIAYGVGDQFVENPRRPLIEEIDTIPWPAYDMFPIDYYRLLRIPHADSTDFVMPVLTARGCTFKCNFCYRMDTGYRIRSAESIIEEVKFLQLDYGITYIDFADELLMSSKQRVVDICSEIQKKKLKFKWYCNGRLNYATPDILNLMKNTGCVYINYGIEAFDNVILKNMNKALTTNQITKGVEATLAAGISPGLNIIFGNIGENKQTLQKGVDFLLKYDDGAELRTIRPVTPYPGSPLYDYAIEKGLLKNCQDFYENKHLNSDLLAVNFTDLTDDEFYECLRDSNIELIRNYHKKKLEVTLGEVKQLYDDKDDNFRGFRRL